MTQLYQSEALIGATLLSLLLSLSLPQIQSLPQEPPGLGVCAPSSTVQYVQSQGGGGAALMVAEEDTTWAQQAERSEWKPLDPF